MTIALLLALTTLSAAPPEVQRSFDPRVDSVGDRKGRERGVFAPTETTLPRGSFSIGADELIWLRLSVALSDRVQVSGAGIAIPFPLAGGGVLPFGGIIAGGAAGFGVAGAADFGIKYRLLDEGSVRPGIAVGYDLFDAYVAGAGVGAGGAVGGSGAAAAVIPAVGLVNVQLNVFSLVAGKHFGALHLSGGAYLLDNHAILPQTASIAGIGFAAGTNGAAAAPASAGQSIQRRPTELIPFVGTEYTLGPRASLMAELFGRYPLSGSFGTTGARWVMREHGEARFRIDAAAVWTYFAKDVSDPRNPRPPMVLPSPYVSMALYFN